MLGGCSDSDDAEALRQWWDYVRYEGVAYVYLCRGEHETAERIAREGIAAGREPCWSVMNSLAIIRGDASPPALMRKLHAAGPAAGQDYDAWYHIAREAAAAGDAGKAFEALRKASELWHNPPLLGTQKLWEKDTRWGALAKDKEFKRILDERRHRIGPVYGELKYFPGW